MESAVSHEGALVRVRRVIRVRGATNYFHYSKYYCTHLPTLVTVLSMVWKSDCVCGGAGGGVWRRSTGCEFERKILILQH